VRNPSDEGKIHSRDLKLEPPFKWVEVWPGNLKVPQLHEGKQQLEKPLYFWSLGTLTIGPARSAFSSSLFWFVQLLAQLSAQATASGSERDVSEADFHS